MRPNTTPLLEGAAGTDGTAGFGFTDGSNELVAAPLALTPLLCDALRLYVRPNVTLPLDGATGIEGAAGGGGTDGGRGSGTVLLAFAIGRALSLCSGAADSNLSSVRGGVSAPWASPGW